MDIALQLADRSERAAASAVLTRAEAADAHTYGFEAQVASFQLEGEATDLGFVLAEKAGLPAPRPVGATGSLPRPELPPDKDWPALLERAAALPEARARALSARAERAREAEARAARGLAVTLGARAVRDGTGDSWYGVAGLSLPLLDRGQREAAPLAALARRREGEAAEASRQAALELARSFHEVEHTGEILDALQGALVPAAAEGARLREAALRAGDATVLEVLLARRTLASARARGARAEAAHAWARVKVWLLLEELSRPGDSK
jgi:outer membrane protein TolC